MSYIRTETRRRKAGLCPACGSTPSDGFRMCAGCRETSRAARSRYHTKHRHSPEYLVTRVKHSAAWRGKEWNIPDGLAIDLITDNCFYCGNPPNPTNGIDRVDNARGYEEDNVVTACKICNQAKHHLPRSEFEGWIQRAAAHQRRFVHGA